MGYLIATIVGTLALWGLGFDGFLVFFGWGGKKRRRRRTQRRRRR